MNFSPELMTSARRLRIGTTACLTLLILLCLYAAAAGLAGLGQAEASAEPSPAIDQLAAALTGTPLAIALWRLIQMLRRVEGGEIFSSGTIADLGGFALFVLLSALISILASPVIALARLAIGGGDPSQVLLTFNGGDFFALLVSLLLFFIVRLLREAQRIADEHQQFV